MDGAGLSTLQHVDHPNPVKPALEGVIEALTERAVATINICDLNRSRLREARREAAEEGVTLLLTKSFLYSQLGHAYELRFRDEHQFSGYLNLTLGKFLGDRMNKDETHS